MSEANNHYAIANLTYTEYLTAFKEGPKLSNIGSKYTPHGARHGGASHDGRYETRTIAQIQARGRWEAPKSVARYRKSGTYEREIAKLGPAQLQKAQQIMQTLPAKIRNLKRK